VHRPARFTRNAQGEKDPLPPEMTNMEDQYHEWIDRAFRWAERKVTSGKYHDKTAILVPWKPGDPCRCDSERNYYSEPRNASEASCIPSTVSTTSTVNSSIEWRRDLVRPWLQHRLHVPEQPRLELPRG